MQVPNMLFYNNMIKCGYVGNPWKKFMYSNAPFLFVDVPNGKEQIKGTSFCNLQEVDVIIHLKTYCLELFKKSYELHQKDNQFALQKFTKNSIYVITPYNAQKNAIAEYFSDEGIEDQVLSIDSSQGREFDLVFVSMVRTSSGSIVQEKNRINVGITRARHGLVIVGNAKILKREANWSRLLTEKAANVVQGFQGAKKWIKQEICKNARNKSDAASLLK